MFVRVRNIGLVERSIPTPFNTSVLLEPNEEADFIWSKADTDQILALMNCDFTVQTTTQFSDIFIDNDDIDLTEIQPVIEECVQLLIGTRVCDDEGIHVPSDEKWTDSESYNTFHDAYESAIEQLVTVEDQEDVDSIKAELESAKDAVEVSSGTQPED